MAMFHKLMNTSDDFVVTLLRLALGVVFFAHGAQKALGWFGGFGFRATLGFFTQQMHIPAVLAVLAIDGLFLGSIGPVVGVPGPAAALGLAATQGGPPVPAHPPFVLLSNPVWPHEVVTPDNTL